MSARAERGTYPDDCVVPSVSGLSVAAAEEALFNAGLGTRISTDRFPVEKIVGGVGGTVPAEGFRVSSGSIIDLLPVDFPVRTVSSDGVPDIIGLTLDEGLPLLGIGGVLDIFGNYSDDVAENIITGTIPGPGEPFDRPVRVFYSRGPAPPTDPPEEPTDPVFR